MNTCDNCKYWAASFNPNKKGLADCDLPLCIPGEGYIEIVATAADDSGLEAKLFTHAKFGCVMHTPKNSNSQK